MTAPPVERRLLVATRNAGKLRELRALFEEFDVALIDLIDAGVAESDAEDELESYPTFEGNALAKARYFFDRTGIPSVADDSGLCVEALGGAPGVHSKRYSGTHGSAAAVETENNRKLMAALRGEVNRTASFVCAAAYVDQRGSIVTAGSVAGQVLDAPRGDEGFGYDPYFWSPELGMTFAEADVAAKQRVSHRARAFTALANELQEQRPIMLLG